MPEEHQWLNDFSTRRCENAFAAIVRLHTNLVFATALRQVGDRALAEEIAQDVFVALAQKAPSLRRNSTLAGWLYRTTVNRSAMRLRSELRRQRRETVAFELSQVAAEGQSIWSSVIPLLDEALLSLPEPDRVAVILHY